MVRDEKDDRLLPHQIRRQKLPVKKATEKKALTKEVRFYADQIVKTRHINLGISGCIQGRKCFFRHVEADEKPSKKSKKGGAKGSVAFMKESTQLGCVSQDPHPRKSILPEPRKIGIKTRRQILQGHLAPNKNSRKERVHREELSKSVCCMGVVLSRLSLRRGHKRKPCTKKDAPAE